MDLKRATEALSETGRQFFQRGWSVGTSSNYSVVTGRDPLRLLMTVSGKDKSRLGPDDFVLVGPDGQCADGSARRPSAEALLHVVAARDPNVGAILHTHSVWSTLLSDIFFDQGGVEIAGYEMLKGLAGITTHDTSILVEILENTQDIPKLADEVQRRLVDPSRPLRHGFLIRRHGLYTWGRDVEEARRHIEILEFLFETLVRRMSLGLSRA